MRLYSNFNNNSTHKARMEPQYTNSQVSRRESKLMVPYVVVLCTVLYDTCILGDDCYIYKYKYLDVRTWAHGIK